MTELQSPNASNAETEVSNRQRCFVAMPIRESGSPEFEHYWAMYGTIADAVKSFDIDCHRVDQDLTTGNISKSIVQKLAESELVIADLTELNPNVFYELGVRHALKRSGTVLIIDKSKTDRLPFDVNQYRVIFYESTLPGVRRLAEELHDTIGAWVASGDVPPVDSPVHDWYPALPPDLIKNGKGNVDETLKRENQILRQQLESLRMREKSEESSSALRDGDAIARLRQLHRAAEAREMPQHLVARAEAAVTNRDLAELFRVIEKFLVSPYDTTPNQFHQLAIVAETASQPKVGRDILRHGLRLFPSNESLQTALLLTLTNTHDTADLDEAVAELAALLTIDLSSLEVNDPAKAIQRPSLVGYLADALHTLKEDGKGLDVIERFLSHSGAPRLHMYRARQFDWMDDNERAFDAYLASIRMQGAEEDAYKWFGNFLHNHGYHVDAAAMYIVCVLFDMNDGGNYFHVAQEIAATLYDPFTLIDDEDLPQLTAGRRVCPPSVNRRTLLQAVRLGLSSTLLSERSRDTLARLNKNANIAESELDLDIDTSMDGRLSWCASIYAALEPQIDINPVILARLRVYDGNRLKS